MLKDPARVCAHNVTRTHARNARVGHSFCGRSPTLSRRLWPVHRLGCVGIGCALVLVVRFLPFYPVGFDRWPHHLRTVQVKVQRLHQVLQVVPAHERLHAVHG